MWAEAQDAGEKEFRTAAAGLLTGALRPAQLKRLGQIDLQVRGHEAFRLPGVTKALGLTARQKEELEASAGRVKEELAKAPGAGRLVGGVAVGGGGYSPQLLAQVYKAAEDARGHGMTQAASILTDEQRAVWKRLAGDPLPVPITSVWALGGYKVAGAPIPSFPPGMVVPGGAAPRPGNPANPADPRRDRGRE